MSDRTVELFLREIREECAFRHDVDPPDYERRDRLWAKYQRMVVNVKPEDRERIEHAINRGTGT